MDGRFRIPQSVSVKALESERLIQTEHYELIETVRGDQDMPRPSMVEFRIPMGNRELVMSPSNRLIFEGYINKITQAAPVAPAVGIIQTDRMVLNDVELILNPSFMSYIVSDIQFNHGPTTSVSTHEFVANGHGKLDQFVSSHLDFDTVSKNVMATTDPDLWSPLLKTWIRPGNVDLKQEYQNTLVSGAGEYFKIYYNPKLLFPFTAGEELLVPHNGKPISIKVFFNLTDSKSMIWRGLTNAVGAQYEFEIRKVTLAVKMVTVNPRGYGELYKEKTIFRYPGFSSFQQAYDIPVAEPYKRFDLWDVKLPTHIQIECLHRNYTAGAPGGVVVQDYTTLWFNRAHNIDKLSVTFEERSLFIDGGLRLNDISDSTAKKLRRIAFQNNPFYGSEYGVSKHYDPENAEYAYPHVLLPLTSDASNFQLASPASFGDGITADTIGHLHIHIDFIGGVSPVCLYLVTLHYANQYIELNLLTGEYSSFMDKMKKPSIR